ncbi:MAG: ArnT family glycosyltransferase [Actinomycetota bacterium]
MSESPTRLAPAWAAPAALAVVALVLRVPAFLADRHLAFDDGNYGLAAIGMRDGQRPFEDLFSAQGPLHLPLVWLGDLLGGRTAQSPRLASVGAGILATLATYFAGHRLGDRAGAVLAAALVATTGTMLWTTGPITGDGIAVAFSASAVWGAVAYRDSPASSRAVLTGVAMGAAMCVKLLVVVAAIPVGWYLWSHRRARDFALAVGAAFAVAVAATIPFGFSDVWEQSVSYHRDSEYLYGPGEQLGKLVTTLLDRDLPLLAVVALGIAMGSRRRSPGTAVLGAWALVTAAVLVFEPAMFRNHIAMLVMPLALLTALRPPPARVLAVTALVVTPWWAVHLDDMLWPDGYDGNEATLTTALRALPDGARGISDEPGFLWRAGITTVDQLNDTSIKRIDQGQITTESVARAAARPSVCAVVVWSNRFGHELPGLSDALRAAGFDREAEYDDERALWLKRDCDPYGRSAGARALAQSRD